ncbi:MAG: MATE family efflux transporter [Ignavibacteria bacterium]
MRILPKKYFVNKILNIALPALAGLSSHILISIVDTAMVGRLENAKENLAAMGLGVLATWAIVSFFSSFSTGTHILVARKEGESDYSSCKKILNVSLILGFLTGLFFGSLIFLLAPHFSYLIAKDPNVEKLTSDYISFRFLGLPFFLMIVAFRGFFFGIGHTKIFMFSGIILNVVNIFLNWILIFGNLGAPKLGLKGAALASSISTVMDFFFYLYVTFLPYYRKKYRTKKFFSLDTEIIKSIIKFSLPVSFQNIFILIGFLIFVAVIGFYGTLQQAATQAVISMIFLALLPCFAFGIAAQTLVGNSLGTNQFKLAETYVLESIKLLTFFTYILALVYIFVPNIVLQIITNDKTIIQTASSILKIAGFSQIFYGVAIILAYSLQAMGNSFFVMKAEVLTNWFIFLPLALLSSAVFQLGFIVTWLSLPIYIIIYSVLLFRKFLSGDWKLIETNVN